MHDRRQFLKTCAAAGAAFTILPSGLRGDYAPSKRVHIAMIGTGRQGVQANMRTFLGMDDVRVVAVCDVDRLRLKAAKDIGFGLARRGIGVVSGMAKGIDSAAHEGCLMGKGFTVAVIGTGIDRVYPPSNTKLSERIAEKGAIVSEFPLGSPPEPKNFPIRNRVISGFCRGVVIVEATKKSGSLITASL